MKKKGRIILSGFIDHTQLRPEAGAKEVRKLCAEAVRYGFKAVCVHPAYVKTAKGFLKGSGVKLGTVAGFPLGGSLPETKAFEAKKGVSDGADEIDMVINIAKLKEGDLPYVRREIQLVKKAVGGKVLKVIIETAYLTDREKKAACVAAKAAGADFVKTSTGFAPSGAIPSDVVLMRKAVGPLIGVKAAGGIKTFEDAVALIWAGADRIGSSSSIKIAERG